MVHGPGVAPRSSAPRYRTSQTCKPRFILTPDAKIDDDLKSLASVLRLFNKSAKGILKTTDRYHFVAQSTTCTGETGAKIIAS
ncbi:hypothetical protein [Nitrosovibrio sp. Nv4]|uniref:hypothetical protein n=1 Tax=Nitrosovibrio sp. Nv4 TaxID=1945880 RepID=UPI0030D74AF6